MDATNLSITLFILGCAVPFALEAIKVTGRLRWTLGSVAAAFVAAAALWLPISDAFPRVAAFVGAIAANPLAWFLLAFALVAIARERWSRVPTLKSAARAAVSGTGHLTPGVQEFLEGLLERQVKAELAIDGLGSRVEGLNDSFAQTTELLERWHQEASLGTAKGEAAQSSADYANNKLNEIESRFSALQNAVDRTLLGMRAIGHRERMIKRIELIEESVALTKLSDDADLGLVDWVQWRREEGLWRRRLAEWIEFAESYGQNIADQIFYAPPEAYLRDWPFDEKLIPDRKDEHRFKTFWLINENYNRVLGNVMSQNFRQAFGV